MKVSDKVAAISKEINAWVKTLDRDDRPRIQPAEIVLLTYYGKAIGPSGTLVEIGTGWGGSTAILSIVCAQGVSIYTIDSGSNFRRFGPNKAMGVMYDDFIQDRFLRIYSIPSWDIQTRVMWIEADSTEILWHRPIDLLFIDGAHTYEGVRGDIKNMVPHVVPGGVVIFHDYHMEGVKRAVDEFLVEKGLVIENRGGATVAVRMP